MNNHTTMVRELIDIAIKQHKPLEITYSKDGVSEKVFSLKSVAYSQQYGNNCICGYCEQYESELTFRVERIVRANIEWIETFGNDTKAIQDGLYLFSCRDDNHLEYELRKYKKGDILQDIYKNEDGVLSWHSSIDMLAYHYIPFFSEEDTRDWIPFEKDSKERIEGFYSFAYLMDDKEPIKNLEEYDYNYNNNKIYVKFPRYYKFGNERANGIFYSSMLLYEPFNKLEFDENIKILAYNYCSRYGEEQHGKHWRLADELGY